MGVLLLSFLLFAQIQISLNLLNANDSTPITNVLIKPFKNPGIYPDSIKLLEIKPGESKQAVFHFKPFKSGSSQTVLFEIFSNGELIATKEVTIPPGETLWGVEITPTIGRNFKLIYSVPEGITCKVSIFNVLGQKVYGVSFKSDDAPYEINLSNLPRGIYFLNFKTEEFRTIKKIFVY